MKIVCIGGGPAGLYFGLLMKLLTRRTTSPWSSATGPTTPSAGAWCSPTPRWTTCALWDPVTADEIQQAFNHWDDIELHFKGRRIRSGGHGFVGIGRKKLLNILQARCEALGVELVFETDVSRTTTTRRRPDHRQRRHQLRIRTASTPTPSSPTSSPGPTATSGWARTSCTTPSPSCSRRPSTAGSRPTSTSSTRPPPPSSSSAPSRCGWRTGWTRRPGRESIAFCEKLFADNLQGEPLMTNARHLRGSAWLNFQRVVCGSGR
jgi:anthraniloyl-CoA monooxygenase